MESSCSINSAKRPAGHDLSAADAGAGSQIDDVIGPPHRFLVVFNDHQGVAAGLQSLQGAKELLLSRA